MRGDGGEGEWMGGKEGGEGGARPVCWLQEVGNVCQQEGANSNLLKEKLSFILNSLK